MALLNVEFLEKEVDPVGWKTFYHFMVNGEEVSLIETTEGLQAVDGNFHPISIHLAENRQLKEALFEHYNKYKDPFYDVKILKDIRLLCSHGEYELALKRLDDILSHGAAVKAYKVIEEYRKGVKA